MQQDMILMELSNLVFLHRHRADPKQLSYELKITLQNLGLSLIHSAHLYAMDPNTLGGGARVNLLSPKHNQRLRKDQPFTTFDELIL